MEAGIEPSVGSIGDSYDNAPTEFQVFDAVNDHTSSDLPTVELNKRYHPNVPVKGELGKLEGLLSTRKTKEVLGFREAHSWRREMPGC